MRVFWFRFVLKGCRFGFRWTLGCVLSKIDGFWKLCGSLKPLFDSFGVTWGLFWGHFRLLRASGRIPGSEWFPGADLGSSVCVQESMFGALGGLQGSMGFPRGIPGLPGVIRWFCHTLGNPGGSNGFVIPLWSLEVGGRFGLSSRYTRRIPQGYPRVPRGPGVAWGTHQGCPGVPWGSPRLPLGNTRVTLGYPRDPPGTRRRILPTRRIGPDHPNS